MRKELACGAVVPGCDFVAHAATEEDLLMKVATHARQAHGVTHLTDELKTKIKDSIKDVD